MDFEEFKKNEDVFTVKVEDGGHVSYPHSMSNKNVSYNQTRMFINII